MNKKLFDSFVAYPRRQAIMRLIGIALLSVCALAFCPVAVTAKDDIKWVSYGIVASFLAHEAAHHFAAGNDEMSWHGPITNPKWEYRGRSDSYLTVYDKNTNQWNREYHDPGRYKLYLEGVAKAGMVGQGMISHWMNGKDLGEKKNLRNFRKGFVGFNILNNLYYLTASSSRGDLDPNNFRSERHRERFKDIIILDTAFLAYEFFTKRSLLPKGTSISFKRRTIMLTWSRSF
jgi:hypothetical protein